MSTPREMLAYKAALNSHGRASDYNTPERMGFVMATVKDANDSLGFEDIHSFNFLMRYCDELPQMCWLSRTRLSS